MQFLEGITIDSIGHIEFITPPAEPIPIYSKIDVFNIVEIKSAFARNSGSTNDTARDLWVKPSILSNYVVRHGLSLFVYECKRKDCKEPADPRLHKKIKNAIEECDGKIGITAKKIGWLQPRLSKYITRYGLTPYVITIKNSHRGPKKRKREN